MYIVNWIVGIIILSFILGELYYQRIKHEEQKHSCAVSHKLCNIDIVESRNLNNLKIENKDIIQRQELQMRGSWRFAKKKILSLDCFELMKRNEYKKML